MLHCAAFSVHYVKRPGVSLDAGCIIAHLKLDDPSRVQKVGGNEGCRGKLSGVN